MEHADDPLTQRAARHAALGEPARLAIVESLTVSDRSPSDLAQDLGLRSNLLAHHLDVLEGVGLVERFASSGDGRRRYVRAHRGRLAALGVRPDRAPDRRVVFVCSQNSARSQLAAALWSARTGDEATSAGTRPAERVHPGAVAAAERAGLDLSGATPSLLDPARLDDFVVTVCDRAREELDVDPAWWHWSVPDPVAIGTDDAFDAALDELRHRMDALEPIGPIEPTQTTTERPSPWTSPPTSPPSNCC